MTTLSSVGVPVRRHWPNPATQHDPHQTILPAAKMKPIVFCQPTNGTLSGVWLRANLFHAKPNLLMHYL